MRWQTRFAYNFTAMKTLIKNVNIVNDDKVSQGDVLINGEYIERIDRDIGTDGKVKVIDAAGNHLFPGAIDDQVHFREPGLTHKGTIHSEARAAVAGGVTSFMEMPNTNPPVFTRQLLEDKYHIASQSSLANYSFFIGASNDNLEEVLKTDLSKVCGLKIFMGSSTGNLLVDKPESLQGFFSNFPGLIATHCEDEATIRNNSEKFRERYGEDAPVSVHPEIRTAEACYKSSSFAVELARRYGTRLHILHISSARETSLFDNSIPLEQKRITSEACIHHLWFDDRDYERLGNRIKWNPAIKSSADREAVFAAVLDDRIDVIATDHAPHTWEEKNNSYFKAPSGGPLVQHSLVAMLEFHNQGKISLEKIARKMSHNPAILFRIEKRGFIREGYYADLALVDRNSPWIVEKSNILYQCGWSPLEGQQFRSKVTHTWVSGHLAFDNGRFDEGTKGKRLRFEVK
jgi:dihydroorotase